VRVGQEVQALPRRSLERRVGQAFIEAPVTLVVAAAIYDARGALLIAQRPQGKHMAGRWEFPGGKVSPGESERTALSRELREELGIEVRAARHCMRLKHAYPDRTVELSLWIVHSYAGTPAPLDHQGLRWVPSAELPAADLLEADRPFVAALVRLPPPAAAD
jgi:8-oxo-dGTP diphosphatase